MGTEYGVKVDGWGTPWSGPDHMVEGRRIGRLTKLKALLDALKSGDLEGSKKSLEDLWSFEPTLRLDEYLIKIGEALSKKLLYVAQKTALAMQADPQHFSSGSNFKNNSNFSLAPNLASNQPPKSVLTTQKTSVQSDLTPKKATSGEFGRIIDVTA